MAAETTSFSATLGQLGLSQTTYPYGPDWSECALIRMIQAREHMFSVPASTSGLGPLARQQTLIIRDTMRFERKDCPLGLVEPSMLATNFNVVASLQALSSPTRLQQM
jgi:hypothetical protein